MSQCDIPSLYAVQLKGVLNSGEAQLDQTHGVFSDVNAMVLGGFSNASGRSDGLTVDKITKPVQTLFVTGKFF